MLLLRLFLFCCLTAVLTKSETAGTTDDDVTMDGMATTPMADDNEEDPLKFLFSGSSIAHIVSILSICISILLIFCFALLLCTSGDLRTNTSQNTFALVMNLLLTYILYFMINEEGTESAGTVKCKVISVMYYFFSMSAFLWALAISWDLYHILDSRNKSRYKASFGRNFAVVTGFMLMITTIVTLVDTIYREESEYLPRFGAYRCFINNKFGHILFYYSPIAWSAIINFIFFLLISFNVLKIHSQARQQNESHIIILKIAFIVSIPNVLILTIVLVDNKHVKLKEILSIIYSALYGLQGAFVSAVFIVTKPVVAGIRESFRQTFRHTGSRRQRSIRRSNAMENVQGQTENPVEGTSDQNPA